MKKYRIEITEIMQKVIEIDANNKDEALLKAKTLYSEEQIVLDVSNYIDFEIELLDELN